MKNFYKIIACMLPLLVCSKASQAQCESTYGKLVINEVMPANVTTMADAYGEFDDWVELHNTTDQAINLQGYFLSDSHGNKTKFTFPDIAIQPNGFLIVWCDGQPEQGALHASFKLNAGSEKVGLYNPDTVIVDYVRWYEAPDDISIGRYPNGHGPFSRLIPTFNSSNTNSVAPGLVINEYQAKNESTAQDQWGAFGDWVEIYNNSQDPINLNGYFLSDKVNKPTIFQFPDTTIQPDDYIIVWCDKKITDPGLHADFKLSAAGDQILLAKPDTSTVDFVSFGLQIPDDSEGRFPNGIGPIKCMIPTFSANNGSPVAIREPAVDSGFEVFPNPASDFIYVKMKEEGLPHRQMFIFDMQGRVVKQWQQQNHSSKISIGFLAPGIYLLKMENTTKKIIVQ